MVKKLPAEQTLPPRPRCSEAVPFEGLVLDRMELHDNATPFGIRIGSNRHIEEQMVGVIRVDGDANVAIIHTSQYTALKRTGNG